MKSGIQGLIGDEMIKVFPINNNSMRIGRFTGIDVYGDVDDQTIQVYKLIDSAIWIPVYNSIQDELVEKDESD